MCAFHLKYRPTTFDDIVGNRTIISSLKTFLNSGIEEMPHVFLFQGPKGSGKTTLARIMCSLLECEELDIQEINSSNDRGIETARYIIEKMRYAPSSGKTRCFVLDEIHKGTKDFFNALLKPLEDTPSHVFFFLCTTEPHKLPVTLRDRCTQFTVEKLSSIKLFKLLHRIVKKEKLEIPMKVIKEIAKITDISPRKALIILEQIRGIDNWKEIIKYANESCIEETQVLDLCRALLNVHVDWKGVSSILKGIPREIQPEEIRRSILGYMNSVLMNDWGSISNNYNASCIIDWFSKPFYDIGMIGINNVCYKIKEEK